MTLILFHKAIWTLTTICTCIAAIFLFKAGMCTNRDTDESDIKFQTYIRYFTIALIVDFVICMIGVIGQIWF